MTGDSNFSISRLSHARRRKTTSFKAEAESNTQAAQPLLHAETINAYRLKYEKLVAWLAERFEGDIVPIVKVGGTNHSWNLYEADCGITAKERPLHYICSSTFDGGKTQFPDYQGPSMCLRQGCISDA